MQPSRSQHAIKPQHLPRSHTRSRSQAQATVAPLDPGCDDSEYQDFRFHFVPEVFELRPMAGIGVGGGERRNGEIHKTTTEKVLSFEFDKVRLSIASSSDSEGEAPPRSSFSGASHPPEPVDEMDTVFVAVDGGRRDSKPPPPASAKQAAVAVASPWDASPPPSGTASPHSSSTDSSGAAATVTSVAPSCALASAKTSVSSSSAASDWSNTTSAAAAGGSKPHKGGDPRWKAILAAREREGPLAMGSFRLLRRLGCGDIGTVYLSELSGGGSAAARPCWFAMKVMDKASLESRRKLTRAETEREILQLLDHPFLPTLYAHFETDRFACLVMEFCPGGDLHALRQRQPGKHFPEHAARFYAAEVLLALEYLHMLGVVYRDLKPENVLVREDGHIMLSDFDLSLRCAVSPTLVRSSPHSDPQTCAQPACIQPTCFMPKLFQPRSKKKKNSTTATKKSKSSSSDGKHHQNQSSPAGLPELVVEPTDARSMSFVGTHEYLAPEIIKGEGHGSAVDWWTFGVFLHELLYGKTPFKGQTNRATLFNVVGQQLKFPECPGTSNASRDLIRGLLAKEPQSRLGVKRGAAEIKQHPFFEGVNWALIRCSTPPGVPRAVEPVTVAPVPVAKPPPVERVAPVNNVSSSKRMAGAADVESGGKFLDFEFF